MQTAVIPIQAPWGTWFVLLDAVSTVPGTPLGTKQSVPDFKPLGILFHLLLLKQLHNFPRASQIISGKPEMQNKIFCVQVYAFSMRLFPVSNQFQWVRPHQSVCCLSLNLTFFRISREMFKKYPSFRTWMHFIDSRFWNPTLIKKLVISSPFPRFIEVQLTNKNNIYIYIYGV